MLSDLISHFVTRRHGSIKTDNLPEIYLSPNNYLNFGDGTGLSGGATTTPTLLPPPPPPDLTDPSLALLELAKTDPMEPTEEPLNWRRRLPLLRIPESVSISFLLGHGLQDGSI